LQGLDLRYLGAYAAGNYSDGDIVIYNGVAYLCVRPTSAAPTAWVGLSSAVNYATTLPASPADGQEAILVDSVTNPTYSWRFRYNNGSTSAYKWEFVGGAPAIIMVFAGGTYFSTATQYPTFVNPTGGPTFTAPRAGEYVASATVNCNNNTAGGAAMIGLAGSDSVVADGALVYRNVSSANAYGVLAHSYQVVATAGGLIRFMVCAFSSGTALFERRQMTVVPKRVS